jgi:hypothetical protein
VARGEDKADRLICDIDDRMAHAVTFLIRAEKEAMRLQSKLQLLGQVCLLCSSGDPPGPALCMISSLFLPPTVIIFQSRGASQMLGCALLP